MDATREIYWNVGTGVIAPMYLIAFLTVAVLVWGFYRRIAVYRMGRPLNRVDQLPKRISRLVYRSFSQVKVLRVRGPGLFHALFFWMFILLFIGTLLVMAQVDFLQPLGGVTFLKGTFYKIFSLTLDLAGFFATLGLAALLCRRVWKSLKGSPVVFDDYLLPALLLAILLSGFLVEGLRMAATELRNNQALACYSPFGMLLGRPFLGARIETLLLAHKVLWWVHLFLSMAFIAVIPFSKLKHIFTTSLNYVFSDLRPKGTITTLDLENPDAEQFGVVKVKDLTWKDIFDADACTRCGRCEDRCPAWNAGKPLSPMSVIQQIGNAAFSRNDGSLIDLVSEEALWACTTCFACDDVCPANIEVVGKIVDMRRYLTLMEGKFPGKEVRTAIDNIEVNSNPFGFAFASRGDWANGLPVERIAGGAEVDVLYFVGCYASFDQRNREVARSFVEICAAAGIRVGILGREEKCCGEPVRKLGNEYLYQTLARENIDRFLSCGVRKIVTTCPHCFHTLSHDYRELGLQADVEHYTTFIERLVSRGILHLAQERFSCTYHDSCYLGRYNDILDPPRHVLRAAGAQITEMRQCGKDSACCGAGGARVLMEETVDQRINVNRIRMAKETQAPLLVSNCPFCLTMFNDATKAGSGETPIQVRDLAEVVAERIKSTVVNPKSEYEITRVHQTGSGHELEVSGS